MKPYETEIKKWLASDALTAEEKNEIENLTEDEKLLRFSAPMDFGTAGLRSTMYMGIGCMNRFTVAQTTKGIAALIKSEHGEDRGVAIACDSRNHSTEFSEICARVLAAEGIKVYIFDSLRPTPELSFAIRELHTMAGINITASHNPKEYNGYKAYWEDGAQVSPEQAAVVSSARNAFDVLDLSDLPPFADLVASGAVTVLDETFDEKYLDAVMRTAIRKDAVREVADDLSVVYTPLHGAGYRLVPEIFRRMGLKHLHTVEQQMTPNGDFPTVKKPNPEFAEAFTIGIELADRHGSDLIIATDPDSDRVGVMVRDASGKFVTVTGNQMGNLLLDYVISAKREEGRLSPDAYCVKSLVSTDMAYKIANSNGVKLHDVLTGFKFIGEVIKNYEKVGKADDFLLGFEESYGYLCGPYARDKDAVGASMMILEMAAFYRKQGLTLYDALRNLYRKYGYYTEKTLNIEMPGLDGIEKQKNIMKKLHEAPSATYADVPVRAFGDYLLQNFRDLQTGKITPTGQPKADVIYLTLENDDKIIIRPSGTEPKIKFYILAHGDGEEDLSAKMEKYAAAVEPFLSV